MKELLRPRRAAISHRNLPLLLMFVFSLNVLYGQNYQDYLGAGHDTGIKIRTSSNSGYSIGDNTVNGKGLDAQKMASSRFLFQSSFGGSLEEIETLAKSEDYVGWINNQFALPASLLLPKLWEVDARSRILHESNFPGEEYFGPFSVHFQFAWWDNNYKAADQLRHRIAFALSQILVISIQSQLGDFGEGLASYYDILVRNAFGNYEDILQEIALDPNMAFYLSHLNNPKQDTILGTNPDENFAREIMQLFSIGLYELNTDGTRKTGLTDEWIPTYDNNDIRELAKVFTGLKGGAWSKAALEYVTINTPIEFGTDIYGISREVPLQMDQAQHQQGPKTIIGNYTIPGGQSGMQDIKQAIHHIFMHPNVGPFIARKLIQQLIKSNPSPGYINRVANAFNDNGAGVRGDLKAVIKAILLDSEARDCSAMEDPAHGKLREPMLRYTQLMHSIPSDSPDGYYWNNGFDYLEDTKQAVLAAPSVFNFYLPDHQPVGAFTDLDLVAPEFQIHNSQTAIGYFNQSAKWSDISILFWDWYESTPNVEVDMAPFYELAADPETLINHLDVLLTHGRLSEETRSIIKRALTGIPTVWDGWQLWRSRMALYLFMISPDYVVFK